jgi:hypothetical protein
VLVSFFIAIAGQARASGEMVSAEMVGMGLYSVINPLRAI